MNGTNWGKPGLPRFDVAERFDKPAVAALRAYLLDERRKLAQEK